MTDMDQGNSGGSPSAEKVTPAKMDAALKAKWVEALRSGKYEQGRSALRTDDSYCCLGVLCDVGNLGSWVEFRDEEDRGNGSYWMNFIDDDPDMDLISCNAEKNRIVAG